ncbi:Ff.00g014480.m01.CDS01 [Fusarium sp. VM40]|nr:Ff.00g014480.m01.CDS01 [Fusarium sp. VM40]
MPTHLAAVLPGKGQPFEIQTRPTPKPGPNQLLIAVKSVAINPADALMREYGLFISEFPAVIGFDMSGLVLEVGENVPSDADGKTICFQPGVTRVAAYSASAWRGCDPDYGPFQEKCLVPWQHVAPLPDHMSWNHAATLPVSVQVPLSAWDEMGIPRMEGNFASVDADQSNSTSEKEEAKSHVKKEEVLLIWGASSSIGTMGVQTARLMRQDPSYPFAAVYATAGLANQEYIRSLGADRVFDYKDPSVVEFIISAAKADGLAIRHCFLATGQLALCQAVLKAFGGQGTKSTKIGSAVPIPQDAEDLDGVEVIFVKPSMANEEERLEQFRYWIGTWLRENLTRGTVKPSPEPSVVGKGLEYINAGLDQVAQGVSCRKLVIEISE